MRYILSCSVEFEFKFVNPKIRKSLSPVLSSRHKLLGTHTLLECIEERENKEIDLGRIRLY